MLAPALRGVYAHAIIHCMREMSPKRRVLRNLPGSWSKREAVAFDRFLVRERCIDLQLWKADPAAAHPLVRHGAINRTDGK
jgi:hypothetical protein